MKSVTVATLVAAALSVAPGCAETHAGWPSPAAARSTRFAQTSTSCVTETPVLGVPSAIGPIRLGATLTEIRRLCDALEYAWLQLEGSVYPIILVVLGDVTAILEMSDTLGESTVRRMSTGSTAARFDGGLGPGMSVEDAVQQWPDLRLAFGEGTFLLSPSHPGFSLAISMGEIWDLRAAFEARDRGDLSLLPDRTHIAWILIT